ncbi:hypothetical protein [Geobacter sp. FeAm09]|uniref:hypothetical protein n=1 Tax=Geobacter sp. FeAm09 TaxID=2597769 RepID=UPI00197A827A|nr:hypothetical protein [Geobacter sp. FeAm09]
MPFVKQPVNSSPDIVSAGEKTGGPGRFSSCNMAKFLLGSGQWEKQPAIPLLSMVTL